MVKMGTKDVLKYNDGCVSQRLKAEEMSRFLTVATAVIQSLPMPF